MVPLAKLNLYPCFDALYCELLVLTNFFENVKPTLFLFDLSIFYCPNSLHLSNYFVPPRSSIQQTKYISNQINIKDNMFHHNEFDDAILTPKGIG